MRLTHNYNSRNVYFAGGIRSLQPCLRCARSVLQSSSCQCSLRSITDCRCRDSKPADSTFFRNFFRKTYIDINRLPITPGRLTTMCIIRPAKNPIFIRRYVIAQPPRNGHTHIHKAYGNITQDISVNAFK